MDWLIAYAILGFLMLVKHGIGALLFRARQHEALNTPMRKRRITH